MARSVQCVGPTAMSATALTETAIGTSWQVPKGTKMIESVKIAYGAPSTLDAAKPHHPRLRIYSTDLKIEPCEILSEGVDSCLTTTESDRGKMVEYPLNIPCNGGEVIYFYGTVLVTVTTAGWMGVTVTINNTGECCPGFDPGQYFYKANNIVTASVTTTLVKTNETNTYRISGRRITGVYGVISMTTAAAATGIIGKFALESSDFKTPFGISWMNEPADSLLSSGGVPTHCSFNNKLDVPISDTTTIQGSFTNGATNIAGSFITGVQFQQ